MKTKIILQDKRAFTLIELLIVIAIIAILAAILMPVLSSAKQRADQIYCLNNMRQWGLAFHMYCDDNNNYVPEEGDTGAGIADPGSSNPASTPNLTLAWYNIIPPEINQEALANLYAANNAPVPSTHSIFSCPSTALPPPGLYNPWPPTFAKAFFMYGENCRLCINWGTRYGPNDTPKGIPQTKIINVVKPTQTVFLAEENPDQESQSSSVGSPETTSVPPSSSCVSAFYVYARHMKNTRTNLAMVDGSCISARTNDCWEPQGEADGGGQEEWSDNPKIYWYPSSTTPN